MSLNRTQSGEARHANKNKIAKTSNILFLFERKFGIFCFEYFDEYFENLLLTTLEMCGGERSELRLPRRGANVFLVLEV